MGVALRPEVLARKVARRGWSLADLAAAAGLSGPTITAARAGRPISPVSFRLIVRALLAAPVLAGVDDLLANAGGGGGPAPTTDGSREPLGL